MVLLVLRLVGLVVLLDQVDEVLDALLRLGGGGEAGLPLLRALVVLGDLAALGRDVGHGGVPVTARVVQGRGALVLLRELGLDLVHGLEEVVLVLREDVAAGTGLQHVLVVDREAGGGVVRNAVDLALVGAGVLEALDPGVRVLVLRGVDLAERAVEDVLHGLGVAEFDNVRELVATEGGVELLDLVRPAWYWILTLTFGYFFLNWALTSLTSSGQVDWASPMSQTVRSSLRSFGSFEDVLSSEPHAAMETNMPATPIAAMSLRFTPPSSGMLQPPPPPHRARTSTSTSGAGTWSLMV